MLNKIETRAKALMVEMLALKPEQLTPDASLVDDLNMDSIDTIDLLMKLSDEFELDLNPADFENCKTISDFTGILQIKIQEHK